MSEELNRAFEKYQQDHKRLLLDANEPTAAAAHLSRYDFEAGWCAAPPRPAPAVQVPEGYRLQPHSEFDAMNAFIRGETKVPEGMVLVNREDLDYMLGSVQRVAEAAYHRAGLVCCRVGGLECCGSPEPEWTPEDQEIMEALSPVVTGMSAMLAATPATVATDAVAQDDHPEHPLDMVAQGGGVDVEKVMALVERYADERHAEFSEVPPFSSEAMIAADIICNEIRALLASPAVPVGDGWMPIETAPKDGTVFLIGFNETARMRGARTVYEARWCTAQEKFTSVNGFVLFDGATHWQPLPPAPAAKKEEGHE